MSRSNLGILPFESNLATGFVVVDGFNSVSSREEATKLFIKRHSNGSSTSYITCAIKLSESKNCFFPMIGSLKILSSSSSSKSDKLQAKSSVFSVSSVSFSD